MSLAIEVFAEIILDFFLEGITEISINNNKKVPKVIRYLCRVLLLSLCVGLLGLMVVVTYTVFQENIRGGLLIGGCSILLGVAGLSGFRKAYARGKSVY